MFTNYKKSSLPIKAAMILERATKIDKLKCIKNKNTINYFDVIRALRKNLGHSFVFYNTAFSHFAATVRR
jgi:hypothetical protein